VTLALLVNSATAVPHPAMTTIKTTTAAMIEVHGVRWTGA
jgi:hypothetical protein